MPRKNPRPQARRKLALLRERIKKNKQRKETPAPPGEPL